MNKKTRGDLIVLGIIVLAGLLSIGVNFVMPDDLRKDIIGSLIRLGVFGGVSVGGILLLIRFDKR